VHLVKNIINLVKTALYTHVCYTYILIYDKSGQTLPLTGVWTGYRVGSIVNEGVKDGVVVSFVFDVRLSVVSVMSVPVTVVADVSVFGLLVACVSGIEVSVEDEVGVRDGSTVCGVVASLKGTVTIGSNVGGAMFGFGEGGILYGVVCNVDVSVASVVLVK